MSTATPSRFGIFTILYLAVGILVFLSIGYTVINKPVSIPANPKTVITDNTPAPLPQVSTSTPAEPNKWIKDSLAANDFMNRSIEFYTRKQYHECIALNLKAIALNPRLSGAYNNLCSAYNCIGDWDSAIAACNTAIALKPDFDLAKNNLNYSYSMKGSAKR